MAKQQRLIDRDKVDTLTAMSSRDKVVLKGLDLQGNTLDGPGNKLVKQTYEIFLDLCNRQNLSSAA